MRIPRQIGQIVREKRLEKGLTQEQLAKLSNTSRSLVYRLEKGTTNGVTLDKLFDILRALELEFAVVDSKDAPKRINAVAAKQAANSDRADAKEQTPSAQKSREGAERGSGRNAQARLEKEMRAARGIKGFNFGRYIKG